MKNIAKIIATIFLILWIYSIATVNAAVNFDEVDWLNNITGHSIQTIGASGDLTNDLGNLWLTILTIIKYIVSWLLVLFLVYVGIQMMISMWNDESQLSSAKRQLRYTIVAIIFINIPGTLFEMFQTTNKWQIDWNLLWTWSSRLTNNIFISRFFDRTLNWQIILFLESLIFGIALFIIVLAGIKIIASRWRDQEITESKNKIVWSVIWLMFIWFIESWKYFIYSWNVSDWANLFATIEELVLFFAGPIAIFFLTLAWWYYITSNWEEDKVKKAKSIIVNTIIATIILLAAHTFLKDLITLNI